MLGPASSRRDLIVLTEPTGAGAKYQWGDGRMPHLGTDPALIRTGPLLGIMPPDDGEATQH
jgi:hypothetical protein